MSHSYAPSPAILSFRRQQELSSEIQRKRQKLSHLSLEITRIKTKNATKELEVWKLEDEINKLRKQFSCVKSNIDELNFYEADSLSVLKQHYELSCKEIDAEMNSKLLDLKEEVSNKVESSIMEAKERSEKISTELSQNISTLSAELETLARAFDQQQKSLNDKYNHSISSSEVNTQMELSSIASRASEIDTRLVEVVTKLKNTEKSISNIKSTSNATLLESLKSLTSEYDVKQKAIKDLEEKVNEAKLCLRTSNDLIKENQNLVLSLNHESNSLQHNLPALETKRRHLHSKLQELKGNIRVFCRIRPADALQCASFSVPSNEEFNSNGKQVLAISSTSPPSSSHYVKESRTHYHAFEFDKIFDQTSTNAAVFSEISQLVQLSLDGFNVCVFAYGQTGSGKTWTMSHRDDGMIPSSFKQIFSNIILLKEQGWEYIVEGQFIEIYNDAIIDLLSPGATTKCEIKHNDLICQTEIQNCTTVELESATHAADILEMANSKRSTASTMANSRSSRSHSIFILKIKGSNQNTGQCTNGTLNLVDLAGSERLNQSQARGDRLKETQAINKSLSCLADVIHSLSQRQNMTKNSLLVHIPFRNSKLTYLLKHSLGGDSKTLMFVNISPIESNLSETINSLRFAAKVNSTKTNY